MLLQIWLIIQVRHCCVENAFGFLSYEFSASIFLKQLSIGIGKPSILLSCHWNCHYSWVWLQTEPVFSMMTIFIRLSSTGNILLNRALIYVWSCLTICIQYFICIDNRLCQPRIVRWQFMWFNWWFIQTNQIFSAQKLSSNQLSFNILLGTIILTLFLIQA